jgi:hypothetical protein
MPLPASFARDGFVSAAEVRKRRHLPGLNRPGILIGTEGETNTGKSEFGLSAPGPGIYLCVDRGFDGMLDNPNPPSWRKADNFAFKVIAAPLATQTNQPEYLKYWKEFYGEYTKALANPDCRTVVLDGDSDSWELQRLAEFGKLTQVPSLMYVNVNAARRAMIARAWDSGKVVIATNRVKGEYINKLDDQGNPVMKDGKEVRVKSGDSIRQGFEDQDYLWQMQLRHLHKPAGFNPITKKDTPPQWGIKILKCKANPQLAGMELWGADCCFAGLVQAVYQNVSLAEWGL